MKYDVFISYRRDKGADIARNLQQALTIRGLKVFFDMEELTDGKFNEKLYDAIDKSKNVIFLYTEGALDRCVNEDDWVRKELEHVFEKNINIVTIAPSSTNLSFPNSLPKKLYLLKDIEVSELNLEKLFNESIAKIISRLKDVTLKSEIAQKEAEEAFLSMVRRSKMNDGIIDESERRYLQESAQILGINEVRQLILIERIEQEYFSQSNKKTLLKVDREDAKKVLEVVKKIIIDPYGIFKR